VSVADLLREKEGGLEGSLTRFGGQPAQQARAMLNSIQIIPPPLNPNALLQEQQAGPGASPTRTPPHSRCQSLGFGQQQVRAAAPPCVDVRMCTLAGLLETVHVRSRSSNSFANLLDWTRCLYVRYSAALHSLVAACEPEGRWGGCHACRDWDSQHKKPGLHGNPPDRMYFAPHAPPSCLATMQGAACLCDAELCHVMQGAACLCGTELCHVMQGAACLCDAELCHVPSSELCAPLSCAIRRELCAPATATSTCARHVGFGRKKEGGKGASLDKEQATKPRTIPPAVVTPTPSSFVTPPFLCPKL